ncbi:hypothetical protein Adt_20462 [Abeliophyllum distichum]|uniref:Uncharacterized protein n=1 Tax=Abeliophyllum distichum TaxID=126358 RepID=A0ABD1SWK9_9LAMI
MVAYLHTPLKQNSNSPTLPQMAYIKHICSCVFLIACLLILILCSEGRQLKVFQKEGNKFGSYDATNINDFRPTAPGNSPGIGHIQQKKVSGNKDDFRPTGPGHSPGVGHSFKKLKKGSNA